MTDPKRTQLRPAYQIGICLALIVAVRVYYAWIESQTYWLYSYFADSPASVGAVYLGLVPIVSLIVAILTYRYFSPALTIPSAAVGGGTAGLIVNSIPGAMIGATIGFIVYSRTLRRWVVSGSRIFLQFDLPALLWGVVLGSVATSIGVTTSDQAAQFQLGLLVVFFIGLAVLLFFAVRTYREQRWRLVHAVAGCIIASGLGLVIGPAANTLYRVYSLKQVGDVAWDPVPRFTGIGQSMWDVYDVYLSGDTTDAQLRLLQGLPSVTSVRIHDAELSDKAVADTLLTLTNLELLGFHNVPIGDEALSALQGSTRLIHLTVVGANITDETFANLAPIPVLRGLEVDGVEMKAGGLKKLASSGRLRYLRLENAALQDDDLAALSRLQGLSTLRLTGTEVTGSGLKHLSNLRWLNNLSLIDNPIEDHYLADLKPSALSFLYLDGVKLTDEGATAISGMTKLAALSLRRTNVTNAQLEILNKLPPTTSLSLDGRQLTSDATDQLVSDDISIVIDDAKITVDDVERLIDIGHQVHLTHCQFDEESIERLASHRSDPHFLIRFSISEAQTAKRVRGGSVQVILTE